MSLVSVEKSILLCIPSLSVSLFSIILHFNLYPPNWSNNIKMNFLSNQNDFIKIAPIIFIGVQMEKVMAPHSSTLPWKIPWMEETGRLQSIGFSEGRTRLSDFTFTFHFNTLEKEMATHSSVLAWRIPGMGEPGGLTSMGSHRVRHDWNDLAVAVAASVTLNSSVTENTNCRY